MRCGFMSDDERAAECPFKRVGASYSVDLSEANVCPGFLVTLPSVRLVASMFPFYEKGELESACPIQPNWLIEGIVTLQCALNERSAAKLRERAHDSATQRGSNG